MHRPTPTGLHRPLFIESHHLRNVYRIVRLIGWLRRALTSYYQIRVHYGTEVKS